MKSTKIPFRYQESPEEKRHPHDIQKIKGETSSNMKQEGYLGHFGDAFGKPKRIVEQPSGTYKHAPRVNNEPYLFENINRLQQFSGTETPVAKESESRYMHINGERMYDYQRDRPMYGQMPVNSLGATTGFHRNVTQQGMSKASGLSHVSHLGMDARTAEATKDEIPQSYKVVNDYDHANPTMMSLGHNPERPMNFPRSSAVSILSGRYDNLADKSIEQIQRDASNAQVALTVANDPSYIKVDYPHTVIASKHFIRGEDFHATQPTTAQKLDEGEYPQVSSTRFDTGISGLRDKVKAQDTKRVFVNQLNNNTGYGWRPLQYWGNRSPQAGYVQN
jgi:hypothetical protein